MTKRTLVKDARGESRTEPIRCLGRPRLVETSVEISLCMIVRDEEARIRECLESIRPYVDEMVVVDTGSTDRTPEIAAELGARVYTFPWCDDFATARNASLSRARGRWIFWMDADDLMPPECGRGLRGLVRLHPNMDAAFHIHVRIPASPGEFGAQVVDHVKLFPNRPDLRFEHRIHEQILPAIRRAELAVHPTDLYVVHQNYDRSEEGQAKKRARDFRLLELDLQDHPEHPFPLFNLGMTYLYATGDYEVAAHYLRRSLARSDPRDSIVRKAYGMLVQCRTGQGDWDGAVQDLEEGRIHYPHDAELLYRAGQVYQQKRRWSEARLALEELVVGQEEDHFRSVDLGLRTYKGRHELALFYGRMGDSAHSESALRELVAEFPDYLPAQLDLAETLGREGNTAEARVLLARLAEAPGVGPDAQRLLGRFAAPALAA